jgi:hypothetical protein
MRILKYNIIVSTGLLCILFLFQVSCKNDTITIDTPDQLFRPVGLATSINGNVVKFSWVPISGATYSLELSRDSFAFVQDLKVIPLVGVLEYTVEDLLSLTRYSARIKAISIDKSIKDSDYKQILFVTGIENIFYIPSIADIGSNQIMLKWNSLKQVSQIIGSATGVSDVIVLLSAPDIADGKKQIGGLIKNTSYTFKIYNGTILRGTVVVKTLP